jgi:hypothetical protein
MYLVIGLLWFRGYSYASAVQIALKVTTMHSLHQQTVLSKQTWFRTFTSFLAPRVVLVWYPPEKYMLDYL